MRKKNLIIVSSAILTIILIAIQWYYITKHNENTQISATNIEQYNENSNSVNETYTVAVEENEESKKMAIKLKEMTQYNGGVTVQQGNIIVSMNTDLKIDSNIANYRTYYGIGEQVRVQIQFDKVIKSVSNQVLYLKFGSGTEKQVTYNNISGSVITFVYNIQEGDNGELKLTNLSGTVTDTDDNSIAIGLSQSNAIVYQGTSNIIADTLVPEFNMGATIEDNTKIRITYALSGEIYIKKDNKITKASDLTEEDWKKNVYGRVQEKTNTDKYYDAKGTFESFSTNEEEGIKQITFDYNIAKGDNGNFACFLNNCCDLAGNNIAGNRWATEVITETTPLPIKAWVDLSDTSQYRIVDGKYYLKANSQIKVGVQFNDIVYNYEGKKIKLKFTNEEGEEETRDASFYQIKDNTTCYYKYEIEEDKFFNGNVYLNGHLAILGDTVEDSVGHKSPQMDQPILRGELDSSMISEEIYIDAVPPKILSYTEISEGVGEVYKEGETTKFGLKFSEEVCQGNTKIRFFGSPSIENDAIETTEDTTTYKAERKFRHTIKAGENNYRELKFTNYTDKAGNSLESQGVWRAPAGYENNQCADTTKPTVTISHSEENNITTYSFNLSDNSMGWKKTNESLMTRAGIASNSFTEGDIQVTNGQIMEYEKDSNQNINKMKVLNTGEGKQTIYIGANKFTDGVGNGNAETVYTEVIIDTKAPRIYNLEKFPSTWTNKDVKLTVYADDEGTGIDTNGYSFNGGTNWQTSNSYTTENNGTMTIKVKDKKGNTTTQTVEVSNIDKVFPTLEATVANDTITVTASDALSGIYICEIDGHQVQLNNGQYTYKATKNGNVMITVMDNAGNLTTKTVEITDIEDNTSDATIIFQTNGGIYNLNGNNEFTIQDKVYVSNVNINKIEYAWTNSETQPTNWNNGGNVTALNTEYKVTQKGSYYLHIKVTDKNNHVTYIHSNKFEIKEFPVSLDESLELNTINNINYIILKEETAVSDLLAKITSGEYTISIKQQNLLTESIGKVKTGDTIFASNDKENYQIYKVIVKGDVNRDGYINLTDIFQLNQKRLEIITMDDEQLFAADANGDNKINMEDIFKINQYRLGK